MLRPPHLSQPAGGNAGRELEFSRHWLSSLATEPLPFRATKEPAASDD